MIFWSAAIHCRFVIIVRCSKSDDESSHSKRADDILECGDSSPLCLSPCDAVKATMNRRTPKGPMIFWSAAIHRRFVIIVRCSKSDDESSHSKRADDILECDDSSPLFALAPGDTK